MNILIKISMINFVALTILMEPITIVSG
ncbi:Hypothetical protein SSCIU_00321 [Mammaliicoccus sciuri]|nr:Hypothetical protein SSCIU_00321 [Mammaliicoccus sciuri]